MKAKQYSSNIGQVGAGDKYKRRFALDILDRWVSFELETKRSLSGECWDKLDIRDLWTYNRFSFLVARNLLVIIRF